MKDQILSNLENAHELERLYRSDKHHFRRTFTDLYPTLRDYPLAPFWYERLTYTPEEVSRTVSRDLAIVILASLLAGAIAKIPAIFGIDEEFFYTRNIGFIVLPLLP